MLNLSVDFLSLVERGISAPSFETLDKIAKRLRLPVAMLDQAGAPLKVRQKRLGHSDATLTLNVYTHVVDDDDRHAAVAIEKLLAVIRR
jgi:integrase